MANPVVNASILKCSMSCMLTVGVPVPRAPSYPPGVFGQINVLPDKMVNITNMPAANIGDTNGKVIFPPSNSCQSQINPTVISASALASIPPAPPSFVPAPCTPIFSTPWAPSCSTCTIKNQPALNKTSKLNCSMGGVIEIVNSPAVTVNIK
ncbi:MAG: DUF4280 domain-containing protein [Candidatus Improbicoccus pseudotrichonymphae]|uniref:DUF4280 domain-containing protein n=1 Tax=Candidatus Improbicoccus pseudotrichonymphae TaxID=3033792 RepID=A0AA48I276_9FIRM|nr:MAG: DUF4280 domain-containing protein [Candidatus Improbicoccus pseudotrichonymphae]